MSKESIQIFLEQKVNRYLLEQIESFVLPIYTTFDRAHQMEHVNSVIKYSLILADQLRLDMDMAYTIAAFHDVGLVKGRETHHQVSAEILSKNSFIVDFFNEKELKVIKTAIIEHRASIKKEHSSIYGKIVSDADKLGSLNILDMIKRSIYYNKDTYPDFSIDQIRDIGRIHLNKKYGDGGYANIILDESIELIKEHYEYTKKVLNNKEEYDILFNKVLETIKDEIVV